MRYITYLEGIVMGENRHERHVDNCDARANLPHFEIHAAEPVLLHRPRLDNKEPKAQLYHTTARHRGVSKELELAGISPLPSR